MKIKTILLIILYFTKSYGYQSRSNIIVPKYLTSQNEIMLPKQYKLQTYLAVNEMKKKYPPSQRKKKKKKKKERKIEDVVIDLIKLKPYDFWPELDLKNPNFTPQHYIKPGFYIEIPNWVSSQYKSGFYISDWYEVLHYNNIDPNSIQNITDIFAGPYKQTLLVMDLTHPATYSQYFTLRYFNFTSMKGIKYVLKALVMGARLHESGVELEIYFNDIKQKVHYSKPYISVPIYVVLCYMNFFDDYNSIYFTPELYPTGQLYLSHLELIKDSDSNSYQLSIYKKQHTYIIKQPISKQYDIKTMMQSLVDQFYPYNSEQHNLYSIKVIDHNVLTTNLTNSFYTHNSYQYYLYNINLFVKETIIEKMKIYKRHVYQKYDYSLHQYITYKHKNTCFIVKLFNKLTKNRFCKPVKQYTKKKLNEQAEKDMMGNLFSSIYEFYLGYNINRSNTYPRCDNCIIIIDYYADYKEFDYIAQSYYNYYSRLAKQLYYYSLLYYQKKLKKIKKKIRIYYNKYRIKYYYQLLSYPPKLNRVVKKQFKYKIYNQNKGTKNVYFVGGQRYRNYNAYQIKLTLNKYLYGSYKNVPCERLLKAQKRSKTLIPKFKSKVKKTKSKSLANM